MFPHSEYHIYTTASGIEKRHVHLTVEQLEEAKYLHNFAHKKMDGEWRHKHRLPVADNVYLAVGDVRSPPCLQTFGYEGVESVRDGDFEEQVFFESMIFHKCTKRAGSDYGPDWDVGTVRDWVDPEHRDKFDREFEAYLDETDRKA